jgi:phenylacetic acid degradation operon negative regulatory protein
VTEAPGRPVPLKPMSARSVVLNTLLGYRPPELSVRALVRIGGLVGIADRATRVALTRMVAAGDLTSQNGVYRLSDRLMRRQASQDASRWPSAKAWDGTWEMALVAAPSRALSERVDFRRRMTAYRLAELREGVWMRPDNLVREVAPAPDYFTFTRCRCPDDRQVAALLWDLPAWAAEAERLCAALDGTRDLSLGYTVTTEVLRHIITDPNLPPELLPEGWPGQRLRDRYTAYDAWYARALREYGEAGSG